MSHFFKPFVPGESQPFDARAAAHLLRRIGFGASPEAVATAVSDGLEATVDAIFDKAEDEEAGFAATFDAIRTSFVNFEDIAYVQAWWVQRMLKTRVPFKEKLTLFWHGHFATSQQKVENSGLLHRQIETLRRLGGESFRDLVLAIAKDPAMLVYLDGQTNTKAHPNENFARELMELFTCGIGHYTEKDVQEAARAFSGWHRAASEFVFNAEEHDASRKEFLHRAGRFDGTDVIDILMQQPATPRRIAERLLRFFATPTPSKEAVDEAAALLDRTQMSVKWFLRELFLSQYFFSNHCYRKRIASPAEYVVGTAHTLGLRISGLELKDQMVGMGQDLLSPPNVKGWDGEQKWINSSTWPKRVEFATLVSGLANENEFGNHLAIESIVAPDITSPERVVNRLVEVLLQGDLSADARQSLVKLLVATDDGPNPQLFRDDEGFRHERTRNALATVLALPEYHAY